MAEVKFILMFAGILAFLTFLNTILPSQYKIIDTFDFIWFTGGIITVAGTCVIVSGIPCALTLAVFGIVSVWNFIIIQQSWIQLLIFTPLVVTLIYIIAKLGRGGG